MPEKNKKRGRPVVYIITVLVIIALIGVGGYFMSGGNKSSALVDTRNYVSYPTINSSISSSVDGKSHTLDIDLVLEFNDGAQVSHDAVYETMQKRVGELDYETLKREDSVEMIEAAVKEALEGAHGSGNVANVYVGNIAIDHPGYVDNSKQADVDNRKKLKGLFKNLQD